MVKFLVPNDSNKGIRVNQIYRQFPIPSRKVATLSRYVTVSQFQSRKKMAMYQNISRALIRSRSASQPALVCASYHQKVSNLMFSMKVACFFTFDLINLKPGSR